MDQADIYKETFETHKEELAKLNTHNTLALALNCFMAEEYWKRLLEKRNIKESQGNTK